MNEPKKRGRKSNAEKAASVDVYSTAEAVNAADAFVKATMTPVVERFAAQAYADRVWAGQSDSVPRVERLRRVKLALDGQGLSMEGVVL
jgi:hypothetical protein